MSGNFDREPLGSGNSDQKNLKLPTFMGVNSEIW